MNSDRRHWLPFNRPKEQRSNAVDAARLAGFSDGVFAIAITLLVLSIQVPELPDNELSKLPEMLSDEWGSLLAYLLSFFVVGRFWISHHEILKTVGRPTLGLATLNLCYLATVVFIPFPTELVGRYGGEFVSFAIYSISIALAILAGMALTLYIEHKGLKKAGEPRYREDDIAIGAAVPAGIFLLSVPLAWVLGLSGLYWIWALAFLLNPSVRRVPGSSNTD